VAQRMKKTEVTTTAPSTEKKQPTVAEVREFYEKNKDTIKNFAMAESVAKPLKDITKTATKSISTFNRETLRSYISNLGSNEKNLRNLSWYLYYRSQTYARLMNFYADMFCLYARRVIPPYDLVKGGDATKMLKSYNDTLNILEKMNLQQEMRNAYLNCFIQDVFYGVVIYDDTGIFIWQVPADYAKISGKYSTGDYSFAIDCSYFRSHQELLEYMPDPLDAMYKEYQSSGQKWIVVPDSNCLCLKFRSEDWETVLPPMTPIFEALINLSDLESIQAVANEQEIYKMIWLQMETLSGADSADEWKVDPSIMIEYFNRMINEALPDYISAAIVPGKLETVSFTDTQKANDATKIAKATETVLNTAGGAEILNGSTISGAEAFRYAQIVNTEYAISSLLPQTQAWVNRFLSLQLGNPSRVEFFPVSVYTKDNFKKDLLESCQYGFNNKIAYNTLNGISEKETLAMAFFEEQVLGLHDIMKYPLSSSFTSTGMDDATGENGRPKDDTQTTSGEESEEKRDKAKG